MSSYLRDDDLIVSNLFLLLKSIIDENPEFGDAPIGIQQSNVCYDPYCDCGAGEEIRYFPAKQVTISTKRSIFSFDMSENEDYSNIPIPVDELSDFDTIEKKASVSIRSNGEILTIINLYSFLEVVTKMDPEILNFHLSISNNPKNDYLDVKQVSVSQEGLTFDASEV
jgi:hypothetical protein